MHTYTCRDIPDLLGLLPTLFGFVPHESVIAIAVDGPRSRFGFRLRMDVPELADVDDVSKLVSGHMRKHGPDAVIVIVVSQDQQTAAALMRSFARTMRPTRIKLAITATSHHYWCWHNGAVLYSDAWDDQVLSPAVAHAVCAGQQIVASRSDLEARYAPVDGPDREIMRQATDSAIGEISALCESCFGTSIRTREIAADHINPILDRGLRDCADLDYANMSRLCVWMSHAQVRDHVLRGIGSKNAAQHAQLWTRVAGYVVPPFEAPVLSLAGLSRWLCGDGAQALMAVERALTADRDFMFARTLMEALQQGVSPRMWDSI